MSKYKFRSDQKLVVWESNDQKCWWCKQPMTFQEMTIDHVLPESLSDKKDELKKILTDYGLPLDFDLNDYNNWLPCHEKCNKSKNNTVFEPAPFIKTILHKLSNDVATFKKRELKLKSNKLKDKLIAQIFSMLDNPIYTQSDLEEIQEAINSASKSMTAEDKEQMYKLLVDSKKWKILNVQNDLALVTNGNVSGLTPTTSSPHLSWHCPNCHNYGPWNGVICMSCGQRSDGD